LPLSAPGSVIFSPVKADKLRQNGEEKEREEEEERVYQ
jgi:hypothetical protein